MNRTPIALVAVLALLAGCATNDPMMPAPQDHTVVYTPPPENGTIYAAHQELGLFSDTRARRVGDLITITLVERTAAQKSSSATASRDSSANITSPTVLGREVTRGGTPILSGELTAGTDFSGEAGASQSNQLTGNITVTVVERLPNGNLVVRGEKWLQLNQGLEYVRISGVVRPTDIGPDNTVSSIRVADARIAYGGRGMADHATRPGLLTRFFMSPFSGQ